MSWTEIEKYSDVSLLKWIEGKDMFCKGRERYCNRNGAMIRSSALAISIDSNNVNIFKTDKKGKNPQWIQA